MNRRHMVQILAVMALSPTAIATKGAAQSDKREVISSAAGVQATVAPDGVVRIAWSRTDVPVTVDGAPLAPAAGLGSWAAFKAHGDDNVMLMGDTVVFEDEITAAMDAAFAAGLVRDGAAKSVIVARGADGSVIAGPEGAWHAQAAPVPVVSAVGAGDSFVAGYVLAMARGWAVPEALALGAAGASAAVMTPATELCHAHDVERLFAQRSVSRL